MDCSVSGDEHKDIPDWVYKRTLDGHLEILQPLSDRSNYFSFWRRSGGNAVLYIHTHTHMLYKTGLKMCHFWPTFLSLEGETWCDSGWLRNYRGRNEHW